MGRQREWHVQMPWGRCACSADREHQASQRAQDIGNEGQSRAEVSKVVRARPRWGVERHTGLVSLDFIPSVMRDAGRALSKDCSD